MTAVQWIARLDQRDRILLRRAALGERSSRWALRLWIAITHLGGAATTIGAALVPLLRPSPVHAAGSGPLAALVVSHLAIQLVKRLVSRARPTEREGCRVWIRCPDRFSFPSGHATSSLAVALAYGVAYPEAAPLLAFLALLVGSSRVVLGVHYPGDVIAGQIIAGLTVLAVS